MSRRLKRENEKKIRKKKLRFVILLLIAYIIFQCCYWVYKESIISLAMEDDVFDIQKIVKIDTKPVKEKISIIDKYENYEVSAQLIIPKINLDTYILKEYSKQAMDICPTKFDGPDANEIGNYCVTGHNYKKEKMFSDLINLEIGDELYLLDNKNGKYTYTIYDIHKVKPDNTKDLEQSTDGKRVITLITCVNYADLRLIIKAVEM